MGSVGESGNAPSLIKSTRSSNSPIFNAMSRTVTYTLLPMLTGPVSLLWATAQTALATSSM